MTSEQVQQAGGRVRCGKCQHVYNALNTDDSPTTKGPDTPPNWLNTPDELGAQATGPSADGSIATFDNDRELTDASDLRPVDTASSLPTAVFNEPEIGSMDIDSDDDAEPDEIDDPANTSSDNPDGITLTVDDIAEVLARSEDPENVCISELMDDAFDEEDGDTIILIEDDEEEAAGDTAGVQTAADDSDNEARQDEDQNIESNTNDPLEFNVPKQQWGRFFTGQYEGPIIEAVGPLHEDQEEPEIDVVAEDAEIPADDTNNGSDEFDDEALPEQKTASLRTAIDNLTMEKSEWQRLLEDADNEAEALFMVEADETENEDITDNSDEEEADNTAVGIDDEDDEKGYDSDSEVETISTADNQRQAAAQINKPTEADLSAPPLWAKPEIEGEGATQSRRWFAAVGLLLLFIMLAIQLLHHNREKLATDPRYGETIRSVYASLDRPLYPAWELSAYKIRGTKAISGESNGDMLDIRAQLAVTGDKPMGEPQIRVILKDRWGNPVNNWLFSAEQYMPGMRPPNGLIQPGTVTPIKLSVVDLGSTARGFQLEICLRREGGVLQCDGQL